MDPRETHGGRAWWALGALLVSGAIGRYFYAWVPRAANGREFELAEVRARLERMMETLDRGRPGSLERAQRAVLEGIERAQWRSAFCGRIVALVRGERELRRFARDLERRARAEGAGAEQVAETMALARRAHRTALVAAHYEDLRALLSSWRWLHRWVAALLVLLVVVHIVHALVYGESFRGGTP
jgi:hypothetical protein